MRGVGVALGHRQRFRAPRIASRSCSGQAWPPGTRYWEEHQQQNHQQQQAPQAGHFTRVSYPPPPPPPPALPPQRGTGQVPVMLGGTFPLRPGLPSIHGEAGTGFAQFRPPQQPFHQDPGLGYIDPSEAFSGLIDSFYRKALFQEIDQVFRGMKAAQILLAVPTYRMLIELYSQLRDFEKMDMVYVEMKKAMMKSAGHQLAEHSPQQKLEASDHFTALLDACYRRGMFQEVQQVYRAMKAAQLIIPVPAYTIILETQFQLKNWAAMDAVWMEMKDAVRKSAGGTSFQMPPSVGTSWGAPGTSGGLPPPPAPPPPGVHPFPPRPGYQAPGDGMRQFQHPFQPPSSFHAPPLPPQGSGPPGAQHFSPAPPPSGPPPPPPGPPPPFHHPAGHHFQHPPPLPPPPPGSGYQFQVPPATQHAPYHFHPLPPVPAAPGAGAVARDAFSQHVAPPAQEQQVTETTAQADDMTSTEHEVHVEVATMTTMEGGGEEQPEQQQEEAEAGETANAAAEEEEHEETVAVQEGVDELVGEDGIESMVTGDHHTQQQQQQQQQLMESSG